MVNTLTLNPKTPLILDFSTSTFRHSIKTSPFLGIPATHLQISCQNHNQLKKKYPSPVKISPTHILTLLQTEVPTLKFGPLLGSSLKALSLVGGFFSALPSLAAETEQVSDKINLEAIAVAIDDFNNRNPFFVAGLTFIWLFVIPLTQQYLKKYKFISAIDAFRKLRDDPKSQLLDIRKEQSLKFMNSPNLKILQKNVVQVEFSEGGEEEFVKEVLKNFPDPGDTVLCILDNFDGGSLVVAELLFKRGFKEAYAIKGGLRGKNGWQAIQEELLPPSVHVRPRKKKRKVPAIIDVDTDELNKNHSSNGQALASASTQQESNRT